MILETKWNRLEIFCYGDRSHIRVQLHMKYYLGAAKLVVTGGKNVIFWHFRTQNQTIPLRLTSEHVWTTRPGRVRKDLVQDQVGYMMDLVQVVFKYLNIFVSNWYGLIYSIGCSLWLHIGYIAIRGKLA